MEGLLTAMAAQIREPVTEEEIEVPFAAGARARGSMTRAL